MKVWKLFPLRQQEEEGGEGGQEGPQQVLGEEKHLLKAELREEGGEELQLSQLLLLLLPGASQPSRLSSHRLLQVPGLARGIRGRCFSQIVMTTFWVSF